jgi:hypothetical protein
MVTTATRVAAVAAATWMAFTASGCSWIGVTRAPERPVDPSPPVSCTRSVVAPVGDTLISVLTLVSGIGLTAFGGVWGTSNAYLWGGIGLLAVGVTTGVSAGFGYSWTADCREIGDLQVSCIAGVEASCRNLKVGPPEKSNRGARCNGPQDCTGGAECKQSSEGHGVCVDKGPPAP